MAIEFNTRIYGNRLIGMAMSYYFFKVADNDSVTEMTQKLAQLVTIQSLVTMNEARGRWILLCRCV